MTTWAASTRSAICSRPSPAGPSPKTHTDPATSTGPAHSATGTPSNPNPSAPSPNPELVPGNLKTTTSHPSDARPLRRWAELSSACGEVGDAGLTWVEQLPFVANVEDDHPRG